MIARAPFGRTGHDSSRLIFGAAALARVDQARADAILDQVRAAGVNHLDTAAGYGDAELRLAPLLREARSEFFLATKTSERTASGARASLERSLERMGVDHVDLIQLHNLVEEDEHAIAHGPGGALEGLLACRDEGLVSFIGVTGHGLRIARMHLLSLERFAYDSVLLPYNHSLLAIPEYARDVAALLERCAEDRVAVQTIKSIARRRWPARPEGAPSWYEPITDDGAIGRAIAYVFANAQLFCNSSSDYHQLASVLAHAAAPGAPPSEAELAADEADLSITPLFDGGELERI